VGVACGLGVQRLEPPGRAEQQPTGVAGSSLVKCDLSAQAIQLCGPQRVRWPGLDRDQQSERRVERAGVEFGPGRREQALRPAAGSGRKHRRALQERGRRGQAPAGLRPAGRALELGGDVLVGSGCGLGPVPCPAVRIGLRVGDLRQRAVHGLLLVKRRRPVGHRAHQRMPEPYPCAELDQPGSDRRCRRFGTDPEPPGRPAYQRRVAERLGRRDQQQPPGLRRQSLHPAPEALLDPPGERCRSPEAEPVPQIRRGHAPGQLQQRQRIAASLGDDPVADPLIQRHGDHRVQQRPRIGLPQPFDHQLRQSCQVIARNAGREDQANRLRRQTPCDKRQDLRGGAIEPLLVIHQADQRALPGHLRQQAQHRQPDEKGVRRWPGTEAERSPQRIAQRTRETIEAIQHRRTQLMQPGERELHLRMDARSTHHPAALRLPGRVVQQRRLAHARLAGHHQHPALTRANGIDQPVKDIAFTAPACQLCEVSSQVGMGGHMLDTRLHTPPLAAVTGHLYCAVADTQRLHVTWPGCLATHSTEQTL
jgi:hypothetical protein